MTADRDDKQLDRDLEVFFQAGRNGAPEASPDLLARVLADAYSAQDAIGAAETAAPDGTPHRGSRRRLFSGLFDAIGGWPAIAGLAAATVAGVWIGYNPPTAVDTLSADLLGDGYVLTMDSSLPDYDYLLADG